MSIFYLATLGVDKVGGRAADSGQGHCARGRGGRRDGGGRRGEPVQEILWVPRDICER